MFTLFAWQFVEPANPYYKRGGSVSVWAVDGVANVQSDIVLQGAAILTASYLFIITLAIH